MPFGLGGMILEGSAQFRVVRLRGHSRQLGSKFLLDVENVLERVDEKIVHCLDGHGGSPMSSDCRREGNASSMHRFLSRHRGSRIAERPRNNRSAAAR